MVEVTLDEFLTRYPEFDSVACQYEDFVLAVLAEAHLSVDQELAGDKSAMFIKAKAAQLIAASPCGFQAGLSAADGTTQYDKLVEKLTRTFGLGCRVLNGTVVSE